MTLTITSPESVGMSAERLTRIKPIMQKYVDNGMFAGISTLIARGGKVIHFEQVGYRDREAQLPMQADSIFRLYSMTKPIICTALMMLYEQGKFDLRDPVAKFIPAFANLKVLQSNAAGKEELVDLQQPVTIWHLLTHTSGLAYDFYEETPVCKYYRDSQLHTLPANVSLEEFVNKLCTFPLAFQPGSQWYYGVNIDVIARLIEIIAEQSLGDFLQEQMFKPLGMTNIGFSLSNIQQQHLAAMYGGVDLFGKNVAWSEIVDAWNRGVNQRLDVDSTYPLSDPKFQRGGIGLYSTIEDYYHFAQMLLNKGELNGVRLLAPKTIELMHMNHLNKKLLPLKLGGFEIPGYGFGLGSRVLLNVAESQVPGSEGEYGWGGAAKTYYWVDPKEELIGIFFSQWMCNFSMIERQFQTLAYQAVL
jgi:CubicO group peptidase (beta-lactamase class C family)